ncbi:TniQ family protein, partial [Pseudoalteromonas rhizosphaerae]|uniref:TniQ family protein n=1 Tax=Pseudoalteromonas rhizosphaerae TaxID=2518973 RepID=UPI00384FEDB2
MQLPLPYPDEIIFSRIVRHFTLSGMTCESYLAFVFGNHKVTIHPYLTAGLELVCKLSYESPIKVLRKQTLAPLFMHFLPSYDSIISNALISSKASEAIRACQLTCVREREQISIKFCPECARANAKEFGISYWHRSHQIPGVESCSLHRVQLEHFSLESRSRLSYYLLPPLDVSSRATNRLSCEFAQYTYEVLTQVSHSDKRFALLTFKIQLKKLGYVTNRGSYRTAKILKSLYQFSQDLASDTLAFLPRSVEDYRYISYLLSGKVSQHPIKFLLFGFWLMKQKVKRVKYDALLVESKSAIRIEEECIKLLHRGESMASINRITGKSRCYIKALALKLNIPVNLKPRYITESIRRGVLLLAKKGFHRKMIAAHFQISSGSVEQIISSEPSLVKNRKQFRYESKRRRYKVESKRLAKCTCQSLVKMIKLFPNFNEEIAMRKTR